LASWRDMVATILALEIHVGAARRGCGATFSFTSIYDACKSTKGVTLHRNWSFAGFACERESQKRKGLGDAEASDRQSSVDDLRSAPPVEAPDQRRGDCLDELLRTDKVATDRNALSLLL